MTNNGKKPDKKNPIIWVTGVPNSGKTVVAFHLHFHLEHKGLETIYLDDEVIKREEVSGIICLANWFQNKIVIIASTLWPDQDTRAMAKIKLVYCKLPLIEAAKRDTYKQSHLFIDQRQQFMEYWADRFEEPKAPDLTLDTMKSRDMSKKEIIEWYEGQK